MGQRSSRNRESGEKANHRKSSWRSALSIGSLAFVIAVVIGGPVGAVLQRVNVVTGLVFLVAVIGIAIVADIIAVAATAVKDVPLNAMASDRVPGAQDALIVVRNAGKVNSLFADIVGDIAGTISGVVATPLIFALGELYPAIPRSVLSAIVIGLIAFFTIGGKAAEKEFAVRQSTTVILWVGKLIYFFKRLRGAGRRRSVKRKSP